MGLRKAPKDAVVHDGHGVGREGGHLVPAERLPHFLRFSGGIGEGEQGYYCGHYRRHSRQVCGLFSRTSSLIHRSRDVDVADTETMSRVT